MEKRSVVELSSEEIDEILFNYLFEKGYQVDPEGIIQDIEDENGQLIGMQFTLLDDFED